MSARTFWFESQGQLRAPWRVLIFCAALPPCAYAAGHTVGPIIDAVYRAAGLKTAAEGWVECATVFAATALVLRLVDHQPWAWIGLGRAQARPRLLTSAFAIGALAIGIPVVFLIVTGELRLIRGAEEGWLPASLRVSLFLAPPALAEELLFRGYIFSVLRRVWGWRATLAVTSVAFGLLHLLNPGATLLSLTLVMLAGVFLGGIVVVTGSLYASWMAHFAWNWTQAVLFHTAVSGIVRYPIEFPGYRFIDSGPAWLTGGAWGPEGGAAAGVGMLGGVAYLFARRTRREES